MLLNNDQRKRWVNGTMGKVIRIQKADEALVENTGGSSLEENEYAVFNDSFYLKKSGKF